MPNKKTYTKLTEDISQYLITVDKEKELVSAFRLSKYWKGLSFPEETIHILIEVPHGESRDSRPCVTAVSSLITCIT